MELNLKGKTAIVTGGGTGIGAGISTCLAEEGVNVAVNFIVDEDAVRDFVKDLNNRFGTRCMAVYGDVSKAKDLDAMIETVCGELEKIDLLVNNAGIWPTEDLIDMEDDSWKRVMDVNLNGPYMLCKRIARHIIEEGRRGKIVNISSKSAFQVSTSGHGHYATAKAGINMLTRVLARELSGRGIVVSGVAPGFVATPLNADKLANEETRAYYRNRLPLGRWAEPEEIGWLVTFLLSDKSDNINGAVVDCTGGMLI